MIIKRKVLIQVHAKKFVGTVRGVWVFIVDSDQRGDFWHIFWLAIFIFVIYFSIVLLNFDFDTFRFKDNLFSFAYINGHFVCSEPIY